MSGEADQKQNRESQTGSVAGENEERVESANVAKEAKPVLASGTDVVVSTTHEGSSPQHDNVRHSAFFHTTSSEPGIWSLCAVSPS